MHSGVAVSSDSLAAFEELKMGHHATLAAALFKLDSFLSSIVVDSVHSGLSYADFLALLPRDECRFCVVDFEFEAEPGMLRDKLVLIAWAPDAADVKDKVVYATSKNYFRNQLDGIIAEVQATSLHEAAHHEVLSRLIRL
ncbi:cofilin [Blastocladiella emersonii ATCC 22665]|nr:cofilin [Blastocladiella emersonii ATCC 22665]